MATLTFTWHGLSCFRILAKTDTDEVAIVTDPFAPEMGVKLPRNLTAQIVTLSHEHLGHGAAEQVGGEPFVIRGPGEYEVKDVFVYGIPSGHGAPKGKKEGPNTLYRFEIGDLSIAHLGDIGHPLTDLELDRLEDIDVLLVPVGGQGSTIGADEAVKIVNRLEPRVVIPMHYADADIKLKLDSADTFFREVGGTAEKVEKLKISRKDLPQDSTAFYQFTRS
ncbi:lactamase [Patescibacteria group bacterium]|nr:MAG: lactamase [Patescibacteria group bacterium]